MNIIKTKNDRDEERAIAKLRNINKEANQREYDLDIKPYITAVTFSNATKQGIE